MLDILTIVLPVFMVVGAGYAAVYFKGFSGEYADGLMRFTQTFAIPCLLFGAVARLDLATVFKPQILLPYYIGSTTCFILGIAGAILIFKRRKGEAVAVGFCAMFSNSVLLGLSIVERAYGAAAIETIVAIIAIHAPFCYILGITTMELLRADGRRLDQTAFIVIKAIFSNGLMIGLLLGFLVNLSGLAIPGSLNSAIEMISRAALPAALFGLGGVLVRYGLRNNIREVAMIAAIRLVVHPLIALFLAHQVFGLATEITSVIVLTAAMSPGVNVYVFANMYDRAKGTAASSILISTVLAVFSVSIWIKILATL